MSTEATGDGEPDTVGAVEPSAEAAAAEPRATAVAAPEPVAPRPGAAPDEAAEVDEPVVRGDAEPATTEEPDGAREAGEAAESGDGGEFTEDGDEYDEGYEEYADHELSGAGEDDEALEYDEDYESGEVAEPRRARRWPRVLLVLGFVVLGAVIVGGAVAIVGSLTHGFKKPVKITYKTSAVFSLKTGDCFDPQGNQSYSLLSCDSPHQAEVFATFTLPGTKWPGDAAIQAQASGGCASRLTGYVNPQLAISLSSTYVYPDSVAWQAGTRTVICEVRAASGELTGSVRGASASAG
jgi:hypothetical protein